MFLHFSSDLSTVVFVVAPFCMERMQRRLTDCSQDSVMGVKSGNKGKVKRTTEIESHTSILDVISLVSAQSPNPSPPIIPCEYTNKAACVFVEERIGCEE